MIRNVENQSADTESRLTRWQSVTDSLRVDSLLGPSSLQRCKTILTLTNTVSSYVHRQFAPHRIVRPAPVSFTERHTTVVLALANIFHPQQQEY